MKHNNPLKTLTPFKEKISFATLRYWFFKHFTNLITPVFYKLGKSLPPHYQFYFIAYHATGHNAMMDFLKHCGVSINGDYQEISGLERYKKNYERLSLFHTHCALALCECNFKGFHQYTRLLNARVPALLLVRDPISTLKSCINFVVTPKEKTINGGAK